MTWLKKLKELEAKTTKGPWYAKFKYDGHGGRYNGAIICETFDRQIYSILDQDNLPSFNSIEFIAEMRNATPKLIAALEIATQALQKTKTHTTAPDYGGWRGMHNVNCINALNEICDSALSEIEKLGSKE